MLPNAWEFIDDMRDAPVEDRVRTVVEDPSTLLYFFAAADQARELLADAYEEWGKEGHPTNRWRVQVERLGAWPRRSEEPS